ncbi:LLM class flavin-dependent oxidoreductase [Chitinophaga horti]|uniref:LLM class flavin-dependent oxidoreductase n=1 Tax=Chitinophaga horti TaxID=2920382 RepID=A0ABY6J7F7_9BACT|nr:LLM class flavin-dependent oxidoreductase [Chitinophaga horti]UYQ95610.1 LLM class flavin-dependent oxidoreductase [Chitinophaga horti]
MEQSKKQVAWSLLELATISQGVSIEKTLQQSVALAQKAEQWGYKRFWLAEHHNFLNIASVATSVLIGHIAGNTKSIRVGSGGIMLPNHSPLIVAEQFGTLAQLYPNRIDLGLGRAPGTDQTTAHAIRSDRMRAVHNFPGEIEQIQQYFSKDNTASSVRAVVAEGVGVPLYILGSSLDSAHLAAKLGLPYAFASHFATGMFLQAIATYRKEFQPSAVLDKPYIIAGVNVIAADKEEDAQHNFTSLVRMFLGVFTGKSELLQPPAPLTPDLERILQEQMFQDLLRYCFVGDTAQVAQKLDKFLAETGVDELMVVSNAHDHQFRLRSFELLAEIMKAR